MLRNQMSSVRSCLVPTHSLEVFLAEVMPQRWWDIRASKEVGYNRLTTLIERWICMSSQTTHWWRILAASQDFTNQTVTLRTTAPLGNRRPVVVLSTAVAARQAARAQGRTDLERRRRLHDNLYWDAQSTRDQAVDTTRAIDDFRSPSTTSWNDPRTGARFSIISSCKTCTFPVVVHGAVV